MILVDAGPLIAALDRDDRWHAHSVEVFREIDEPLISTWPALTEAFYMLAGVQGAHARLWELLSATPIEIDPLTIELHARMAELMAKYADLPMDLADASLVAVAEKRGIARVFTVDRRDFSVYRPKHRRSFSLL